ncbi:DUF742 domain-containing protein [Allosaccharopolyspora coralli]|uniref:DUF742 domain-containing protein n=1 Tax=Allosaccharopolyspora coralli TaxID=2665642 RepID=A0A5Q3QJD8_9PSEU|nr:DUF742 domain-containing protein [Allosaccharopolyspora coralli]QGK71569.1 DUF742 domain-containing protein [Allosaccharopolyspora coralli]
MNGWDTDDQGDENSFADVVNGFTFGRGGRRSRKREPEQERPEQDTVAPRLPRQQPGPGPRDEQADSEVASSIRPYAWTGGRTRSQVQLELETLVSTSDNYRPGVRLSLEHQSVVELCHESRSVAEVASLLSVPLGVARVLLADMAELGLITVHQTVSDSGSEPHLMLMERVLSGLRRL